MEVVVASIGNETSAIRTFELVSAGGGALPPFTAGAHIDVHLANGLVRQYSLCNHPLEQHRYVIGVLKDTASRGGSVALHEAVAEGDVLNISAPRNLFNLYSEARRSLLFAGGIGITPILCMAEHLAQNGAAFELHYCARSEDSAAFIGRLKASSFASQVVFHFDDDAGSRLDADQVLKNPAAGTHLYVCGPGGFMEHILGSARANGWHEEQLHKEYFAAAPVDAAGDGSFVMKIASTGQELTVSEGKSAVAVLHEHGFDIPISCEMGFCGTCLTRVIEGTPDHRDTYLTEAEQAANDQFLPCCSRAKTPFLVVDL
ncbi:vanillate O-demethylase oxidoreductase [Pseudomonas turukhanskensis]|uniref:Vanillate O-demethylase oxidoreductase n=2 Tax=Pseudomonas turukhanskensis TaxID=1806536 RepID=A0A9W6KAG1_9PSED|nr:vanillate O-demethylase oxidoreductase [Pseudomonas turukhanskensis]